MPELHGDASMEENDAQRRRHRRHRHKSCRLSSELPHTKTPSPRVAHNPDSQQHLAFAVEALWSTTTARTGRRMPARDDCAQARGEQVRHRSAAAPPCSRARSKQATSYLCGPRSPDRAQAAQIEPARVGAWKLAEPPAAPGRRTTSPDPAAAPAPGASRRPATSVARAVQIGPKRPRSSPHASAPGSWPNLLPPLAGAPPRQTPPLLLPRSAATQANELHLTTRPVEAPPLHA
jgi:hypothetical protein